VWALANLPPPCAAFANTRSRFAAFQVLARGMATESDGHPLSAVG